MFSKNRAIVCAVAAALSLGGTGTSQAAVHSISPGDDIQAAIDAASTGDTIQFAPGTYTITAELNIFNKGITLQGMGKALGTTIQRDAGSAIDHRIFYIHGTAGSYNPANATVINGFTIKNGVAPAATPIGGNIYVEEAPYTLIENSIIENGLAYNGGGINMSVGGTLLNSIVRNNNTTTGGLNLGGGVYMRNGGNTIENSIIYNNGATVGGGVAIQNSGIDNDPALGGADSRTRIINATITGNTTTGYYGIHGSGVGSQLFGKQAFILDSVVWDNSSNNIENIASSGGPLDVSYTNTENAIFYSGTNNIATDPLFQGTGADPWDYFKLQAGSPALTGSSVNGIMGAYLTEQNFQVPEPASLGLIAIGGLALLRRRRHA